MTPPSGRPATGSDQRPASRFRPDTPAHCRRERPAFGGAIHDRERPPRSQARTLQRMRTSATGHRHVAGERRRLSAAVDDKIMPERLSSHCGVDRFVQQHIGRRRPDRLSQINPVVLAKTHEERPVTRYPDPIAGLAKIVGERCDESKTATGLRNANVSRRAAGRIRQVDKRIALLKLRSDPRKWHVLIRPILASIAQWHGFDKCDVHALCVRPLDQGFERSFVEVPQCHRVDLHFETRCAGGSYTLEYEGYVTAARYFFENIRVERIQ